MELTKATRLIFLYGATCSCAKYVSRAFLWVRIFNTGRINDLMSINRLDQRQTIDICTSSVPLCYSCTQHRRTADNSSIQLEIMLRFGRCIISLPPREDLGTVSTKLLATSLLWCLQDLMAAHCDVLAIHPKPWIHVTKPTLLDSKLKKENSFKHWE